MQVMKVDELIPHKMNDYFFDDITGEPWEDFLRSVKTSGVIEPIIATQDKVIVSGHQRIRACKKLGIKEVNVEIRHFESDEEVLKQLIETNICQRGLGNTNPVKLGRCIKQMEEFYGIKNGGDRKSESHNVNLISQSDLAEQLNMSKMQLNRYKSLTDLIPELQDAVQSGQITATTAMGFVKKLSHEEQKQLAEQLIGKDKVSGSEVQKYIEENKKLRSALSESEAKRIAESGQVKEVVREVEVVPDDYEALKSQAKNADIYQKDFRRMQSEYEKMSEKWKRAEEEKDRLQKKLNEPEEKMAYDSKLRCFSLCSAVKTFLDKYGGMKFNKREIDALPKREREDFNSAIKEMRKWIDEVLDEVTLEV